MVVVGLMVLAALSFTVAALGTAARAALIVGLVTSALAMLVAVLSLGALLAPTFVAAAIALMATRPGAHTRAAPDEPQPSQQRGGCPLAGPLAAQLRDSSCPAEPELADHGPEHVALTR
jgi:hypothetical protein